MNQILNAKSKYLFSIILKLVIVISAFYFIYQKIFLTNQFDLSDIIFDLTINWGLHVIYLLFFMTISNWFLEIKKWQTLVKEIKQITFFESLQQSLGSLTASLITPNRIGEYGAKAIYYPKEQQKKILFLNFVSNTIQMLVTVIFGAAGLFIIYESLDLSFHAQEQNILLAALVVILFCLAVFYFRENIWNKFLKKVIYYFRSISTDTILKTVQFSIIRYLIFSHQFYFLLVIFGVELDYLTVMGIISSMYIIASIIPGFVIFDFIIKGSVAISLFGIFGVDELVVLTITTTMWMLNFALPSIAGSYFVLTFKLPEPAKIPVKTT